jgi:hypothetical protein
MLIDVMHAGCVLFQAAFELVVEPVVRTFSPDLVSNRSTLVPALAHNVGLGLAA